MTTRVVLGVWTLALLVAAGAIVLVATSDHVDSKLATILLAVPIELAFVASGIVARAQRPENKTGILLIFVGFAWALGALTTSGNDYVFTLGLATSTLFTALLAHLLLAFPTGNLGTRTDRRIVAAFYAVVIVGPPLAFVFDEGELANSSCDGPCPTNVLSAVEAQQVANVIEITYALAALALASLVLVRMVLRWRRASAPLRRSLAPVLLAASLLITLAVIQTLVGFFSEDAAMAINWIVLAAVLLVPLAFLYGLVRPRFGAATRRLVAELSQKRRPVEVQAVLRRVLRDPELELGYRTAGGYVDVHGDPLELPGEGDGRVATTVADEVIVHDAALRDQPELDEVLDAVHIAMERGLSLGSLESSERRATALLEAIPDSMYRVAADGTFIEYRLSETARLPIDADDLVGLNVRDVLSPEASDEVFAAMERSAANDTVEVVNYTLDFAGDPRRYLEARIVKSGENESVAIVRDITDRTLQQQALEALAEGRAALSRVAVAVATAATAEPVFAVVTEEVGRLFGANASNLIRFDKQNEDSGLVVGRWSELAGVISPVGTRIELLGGAVTQVRRTGRPARARVPDIARSEPELVARLQELGITSFVASPIEVSGELWGTVVVWRTGDEEFAEDVEERLVQFGKLVAVAVANAEAREQLAELAAEQAALSRVAVAVATASRPEVLFDTVTEEVARRLGADAANLVRFEPRTNEGVIVGKWSEPGVPIPAAGTRVELLGGALQRVLSTGRPARGGIDDPENSPALVARLTELGVTSLVAAPIEVSGELWGAVVVSVTGDQTFAPDAEERIGQFARLVAVALANAEARERLSALAEEQAALSRVAVAVATASEPEALFNVVTEQVAHRLGSDAANLIRFQPDNELEGIVVGRWSSYKADFASIGQRVQLTGGPVTRVRRTGRPARGHIDDPEITSSELVDQLRERGVRSMVAAPIEVSGELWGAVVVSLTGDGTFASDAEARIGQFASLVAVALANAEAREELSTLAEEQAALSRVAVAVATGEHPERLFNTVTEEVTRLFDAQWGSTVKYDGGDEGLVVGNWHNADGSELMVGDRFRLGSGAIGQVKRTGRPARVDYTITQTDVMRQMVAAPIVVSGRLWGATTISVPLTRGFPPDAEERLGKFASLVAVALANAEAIEELTASRARIVQAGDAARRRLERNLHDGAQQRLVTLSLTLRLAQARLHDEPAAAQELLEASSAELAAALEELRELARGLHPAILSDRGLGAALEALATRAPLPVELDGVPHQRLPPPVEAAAYYVVAESLTNVAKYAEASTAHVSVVQDNGFAIVEVVDDGVGGVDLSRGSGLRGLADRVEALDGRLTVSSETGRGTRIRAEIPCSES